MLWKLFLLLSDRGFEITLLELINQVALSSANSMDWKLEIYLKKISLEEIHVVWSVSRLLALTPPWPGGLERGDGWHFRLRSMPLLDHPFLLITKWRKNELIVFSIAVFFLSFHLWYEQWKLNCVLTWRWMFHFADYSEINVFLVWLNLIYMYEACCFGFDKQPTCRNMVTMAATSKPWTNGCHIN